ncbi:hypothetical protein [Bradyrhizobium sp. CCBAU 45389]|uniref:hypothetical protein n=1 Tax=Bradyrhizobium sp. CCBAU 45389 TaxID=858429 RepID=UPI00230580CE|nr:hypothetical protein [Bradyrhizobium sp. CCBAU 45389]
MNSFTGENRAMPANQCRAQALNGMPRENDLEGKPDMGGKHGGQAGQPKLPPRPRDEDVVAKRHTGETDRASPPTKSK